MDALLKISKPVTRKISKLVTRKIRLKIDVNKIRHPSCTRSQSTDTIAKHAPKPE